MACVSVLLLAACGDSSTARSSPATSPSVEATSAKGHRATYVGPITTGYEYADPGVTLEPPPASVGPDLRWTDAFAACVSGPMGCVTTGDAVISLAKVTGPGNAEIGGRLMFDHALTYVVTWGPTECVLSGGSCRGVDLITAQDGNLPAGSHVYTFQVPAGAALPD